MAMFSLTGRTVLVTGSTQGIGFGLARGLAEAGARVVINGRTAEKVDRAVSELTSLGLSVDGAAFDVTSEEAVLKATEAVDKISDTLDILVNNAGGTIRKPIQELTFDEWKQVLDLNLTGAFLTTRAFASTMIARREGKIINICSLLSDIARPENTAYAASKGGLRMYTRALAVELGRHNIQANGIAPGYFRTPLSKVLQENREFDRWLKARTPMGRWGNVDELVGAAVFLASSASNFVTGQIINVDGGITASL